MKYPVLKYIENSSDVYEYLKEGKECQCCGNRVNFYTTMIYSEEDIDVICHDCVVSGKACAKFNGEFNEAEPVDNFELQEEVCKKTPTLPTCQELIWPACCGDYPKYLRRLTSEDLLNDEVMNSLKNTFKDEYVAFDDLGDYEDMAVLFKCNKCGQYHAIIDLD